MGSVAMCLHLEAVKAVPHGKAFTQLTLKTSIMKKLFTSFFQPNDDNGTHKQTCEQEPRPPRHIGGLHDAHVVTSVMVSLVD